MLYYFLGQTSYVFLTFIWGLIKHSMYQRLCLCLSYHSSREDKNWKTHVFCSDQSWKTYPKIGSQGEQ